ncbi:MAG TPA: alpha/beta hydrolase [Phenylobacterium sp.]
MAIRQNQGVARRASKHGLHAGVLLMAALTVVGCNLRGGVQEASADPGPRRLAALPDGRKLNLACAGRGSPTVLLEAGFGADSQAWFKVQPALAKLTRVCAYDRAGYGYSDPGPSPRDGAAVARDLDQALAAADIAGPFIVVGHSAGGLYARLFAARRAQDVAGLVLLDPTIERNAPQPSGDGLDGLRQRVQRCLAASQATPPASDTDSRWSGCRPANPSPHQLEVSKRPATWSNQLSELDTLFGRTSEQATMTVSLLKSMPLYVITASQTANAAPTYGFNPPQSVWELLHQRLASRSDFGSQRTVFSSHMIMLDRPEIVIAATEQMIAAQRAGHPPEALPPAEREFSPGEAPSTSLPPTSDAGFQGILDRHR